MKLYGVEDMELSVPPTRGNTSVFHRVKDVKFCKSCGEMFTVDMLSCKMCGSNKFLRGEVAECLAGYLKLSREGMLKKYLKTIDKKKSSLKMNDKRIAIKLLADDKLIDFDDKATIEVVYKTFWKRY
jgi:predicted amidophosphoribosyltransferase